MKSSILMALDIGSGTLKGVIGEKNYNTGNIEILAVSEKPCLGIRNGEITNPEQVSQGVIQIKDELWKSSGIKIKDVVVNIGGAHLFSVNSQGLISVARADRTISKEDVLRAQKEAEAISLASNKEVIDIFPKEFIVDGEGGIKEPAGLRGIRLEVKVLLACVFSPILNNLEKAINLSGLNYLDSFITPMAVSQAVLSQEQKELGCAVLDIGFSVSSLAVFNKGDICDFAVFPLDPDQVKVDRRVDEMGVLLTLTVNPEDMGQIIGKAGSTARAIRNLVRIVGLKNHARVNLKIEEPEGGRAPRREFSEEKKVDLEDLNL